MPPRSVSCCLCGGRFFAASFRFHFKSCSTKYGNRPVACPFCGLIFDKTALEGHLLQCQVDWIDARSGLSKGLPVHQGTRVECHVCKRLFSESRIQKHQSVCSVQASSHRRPFDSRGQRLHGIALQGGNLMVSRQRSISPQTENRSNWRTTRAAFLKAVRSEQRTPLPRSPIRVRASRNGQRLTGHSEIHVGLPTGSPHVPRSRQLQIQNSNATSPFNPMATSYLQTHPYR